MYLKDVMSGANFQDIETVRSKTARGYGDAVNTLFQKRGFPLPIRWSEAGNIPAVLVNNWSREEDVASQRSPLDNRIFAQLHAKASVSESPDSLDNLFFELLVLARYVGPRSSEYAQTKQSSCDYHTYPSGGKVVKAFTANDFSFYDEQGNQVMDLTGSAIERAASVKIVWRIQKNCQNGQHITLGADTTFPILCPVRNCIRLVERARRLDQPTNMPLCVYPNKQGHLLYLTGSKVAVLLRNAVKHIRPDTPKEDLKKYSAHSLRVWACVLLDEAGKSPDFIKKRLRWMGDSFRMYLRDTSIIQSSRFLHFGDYRVYYRSYLCVDGSSSGQRHGSARRSSRRRRHGHVQGRNGLVTIVILISFGPTLVAGAARKSIEMHSMILVTIL